MKTCRTLCIAAAFALAAMLLPARAQDMVLTLESCRALASGNAAAVRNARMDAAAARLLKEEAFAEYFPKVSINAYGFRAIDPLLEIGVKDILGDSDMANNIASWVNGMAPMYGINPYWSTLQRGYGASVSLIQPVFAGGRIVAGNRLAALGVQAAEIQRTLQERNTVGEAERLYWQAVSLEEKKKTIAQARSMLDGLHKDLSSAISAGLVPETDMLALQLKENELRSAENRLTGSIRLVKMSLCDMTGVPYTVYSAMASDDLPHIDSIVVESDVSVPEAPEAYFRDEDEVIPECSEMRLLDISVEAKKAEKRMTLGEVLPSVGLGAAYGYGDLIGRGSFNGAVFATLKVPVTDWGKYSRKLRRQEIFVQKAENDREDAARQLRLRMRKLWLDLTVAWEQLALAQEGEEAAAAAAKSTEEHYLAGLVPLSDLLGAQTDLRGRSDALTDARIAYRTAVRAYEDACGVGNFL